MGTTTAATESKAESTAVTTTGGGVRGLLSDDRARQRIEPFLLPGASYDRVMAGAHYAARQNPAILECTPHSIIDAVARIQQWNLEIGLTAHLVPFNTRIKGRNGEKDQWVSICTPIADYKGIAELMVRSGAVRHVEARVVYEGEHFVYCYGLETKLEHQPCAAKSRGAITHAYVILRLPFGQSSFEVMAAEDIDAIRQKNSKHWKEGPLPAWYAKKTVVRQAAKLIPKDPRFASALAVINQDEDAEFELAAPDDAEDTPAITAANQRQLNGVKTGVPNVPVNSGYSVHEEGAESPVIGKASRARAASAPDPMEEDPREAVDHEMGDEWIEDHDAEQEMALDDKRATRRSAQSEGR